MVVMTSKVMYVLWGETFWNTDFAISGVPGVGLSAIMT